MFLDDFKEVTYKIYESGVYEIYYPKTWDNEQLHKLIQACINAGIKYNILVR